MSCSVRLYALSASSAPIANETNLKRKALKRVNIFVALPKFADLRSAFVVRNDERHDRSILLVRLVRDVRGFLPSFSSSRDFLPHSADLFVLLRPSSSSPLVMNRSSVLLHVRFFCMYVCRSLLKTPVPFLPTTTPISHNAKKNHSSDAVDRFIASNTSWMPVSILRVFTGVFPLEKYK